MYIYIYICMVYKLYRSPQWISHQPRDPFTASKAKTKSSLQRPAVAAPRTEVPSLSQRVASAPCFSKTWATWVTINGRNHGIYGIYMGYIYIYGIISIISIHFPL